jgi:outer membrane protein OmpA-like peptidoglycan-associated protein
VKWGPVSGLVLAIVGSVALWFARSNGYLSPASAGSASVGEAVRLPDVQEAAPAAAAPKAALPSEVLSSTQAPEIKFLGMAWNAQISLAAANGGPQTTSGSLMEKHGVNLTLIREDDVGKMGTSLIAFATALSKGNPQPTVNDPKLKNGANFMAVMGDGSAATIAPLWSDLKKLGPDYVPEVIGSSGYSRGEDKLMGPAEWKANPQLMRGSLVAGFLRDGDWNIGVNFANSNNIPNNPDEHTWDPDAVNWFSADDFLKAADAYINGVCEDRDVVRKNVRTGEKKHVCVNAVVTWTPGDVNIAKGRGGLVSVASTKEYRSQMPMTIIGIKKWDEANRKTVEGFLSAMYEAGDQVKTNPAWLQLGGAVEAKVYNEQNADYWVKYFKGVQEADKTGVMVDLGGSSANNLQDALYLFGLVPGKPNLYCATYTSFGNLAKSQYPKLIPSFSPCENVLNTSYTENLAKQQTSAPAVSADLPQIQAATEVKDKFSSKNWSINFETGQASVAKDSIPVLRDMADGLNVANGMLIEIQGHTDNTGDPARNLALSQARADFVKNWLVTKGYVDPDRFAKVKGFGDTDPAATNETETGRAKNRRVVAILGH